MEKKCRERSEETKLKCIMEREAGKSYSQIARENGVRYTTVMKWCQQASVEDLMKENKTLMEELSYYKHKSAYHKALNEMLLKEAGEEAASKKNGTRR